ncbi:hypothetical protein LUZ61_016135 [Rhynchospora tenuis]|uniref:Histidine-containing phosphotransfer protein n=1 Tax=Rhynchospora tenuis TaxID=198213 RepID=A0AAD6EJP3_9POAL|nr:hypothetical protein LUZ61_016135 [Rhynchospora tenuis]
MAPRSLSLAERKIIQRHTDRLLGALVQEGLLNHLTYQALKDITEDLEFTHDWVALVFRTAGEPINKMRNILSERSAVIDQNMMAIYLSHIKEPSDCIGTIKVSRACQEIRAAYLANDKERCLTCIRELERELLYVKPRLQELMTFERDISAAGGRI